ncbi:MAG: DUF5050 domain-containing protein, partial [Clostridia bacterium]
TNSINGNSNIIKYFNNIYYINNKDNNTLYKYNLDTNENEKVVHMSVSNLNQKESTVFFKVANEKGLYLYNLETKFLSHVTKLNMLEFDID